MKKILLLILVCSSCLWGCGKKNNQEQRTVPATPSVPGTVQLSSMARQRFSVTTVTVQNKTASDNVWTTGEIKADENRVFHINSLTNGRVKYDYVKLGDSIRAGQTLAVIENLEIVKIYSEYIHQSHENEVNKALAETRLELAKKNYARIKKLFEENIAPQKDIIKAESDLRIEQQTVDGLNIHSGHLRRETQALLAAYGARMPAPNQESVESTSPIRTTKSGVVTKKNITVGDVVSSTEPLYVVGDLSKVWLDIAVYDKQLSIVKQGSMVTFKSDSLPGKMFGGHITYIQPSAEEPSGTFLARVELPNPKLLLKPGMLGQVSVENPSQKLLPFLPDAAIQREGKDVFVFIDRGGGKYQKRTVVLGKQLPDGYLAEEGVSAGDQVVTAGSFALKAEMLKSSNEEDE